MCWYSQILNCCKHVYLYTFLSAMTMYAPDRPAVPEQRSERNREFTVMQAQNLDQLLAQVAYQVCYK